MKPYRKRLTNNNKKVKALLFSMPPVESCLNHKSCASTCYAIKAYRQYPPTKALWDNNLDLAKNDLESLHRDLMQQLKHTRQKTVRIHQSGDFISQDYINVWAMVASSYPNISFYGYTKVDHILDLSILDMLPNVNIIRSMINGKRNYGSLNYVTKLSQDTGAIICPATMKGGDDIKCGLHCFECMDPKTKVVFVQH